MIVTSTTKGTLAAWSAVNAEIQCGLIRLDMNDDIVLLLQMLFAPASEKWLLQLEVL